MQEEKKETRRARFGKWMDRNSDVVAGAIGWTVCIGATVLVFVAASKAQKRQKQIFGEVQEAINAGHTVIPDGWGGFFVYENIEKS